MKVQFSEAAERDFKSIFIYTLEEWGGNQAAKYRSLIRDAISEIEKNPRGARTRPRDDLFKGMRVMRVGKHYIFFEIGESYIEIIRILHEKMDFGGHLKGFI